MTAAGAAPVPPPGLELDGVVKRYGARQALGGISLQARAGELLTLVGPSGSGKSTLLRVVAGLAPHDAGRVLVAGRDVGSLPPAARDVAMVFQGYALFPHLSVRQNLAFGMAARGEPAARIARRVAEVAAALGLEPLLERVPSRISGGERQRAALGRAMLREPRLFLLDEPLSSLDAQLRVSTRAEIQRLHARLGVAMVYVTHDQAEALSLGQRVGVLRDGRLEDLGTPQRVYRRPRNLFVARFVGSPAMNTLDVIAAPPAALRWGQQALPVPAALAGRLGAAGRPLVLGLRAEDLRLHTHAPAAQDGTAVLPALVQRVEFEGERLGVELMVAGSTLLARAAADFVAAPGQALWLGLPTAAMHLFDAASGENLAAVDDA